MRNKHGNKSLECQRDITWLFEDGILGEGGFLNGAFLVDTRIFIWSKMPAYSEIRFQTIPCNSIQKKIAAFYQHLTNLFSQLLEG